MLSPDEVIGASGAPISMQVERGRLRLFARATGLSDPVYFDVGAARARGYPDVVAPPTFLHAVELDGADPFEWITDLGVDMKNVLHGGQRFAYERLVFAGDTVTAHSAITDVYEKKSGTLMFIDRKTDVRRDEELVAVLSKTVIVRTERGSAA